MPGLAILDPFSGGRQYRGDQPERLVFWNVITRDPRRMAFSFAINVSATSPLGSYVS